MRKRKPTPSYFSQITSNTLPLFVLTKVYKHKTLVKLQGFCVYKTYVQEYISPKKLYFR